MPVSAATAMRLQKPWSTLSATGKPSPNPSRLGYRGAFLRASLHREWIAFGELVSLKTPVGIEVRADVERQEKVSAPKGLLPADLSS